MYKTIGAIEIWEASAVGPSGYVYSGMPWPSTALTPGKPMGVDLPSRWSHTPHSLPRHCIGLCLSGCKGPGRVSGPQDPVPPSRRLLHRVLYMHVHLYYFS